MYFLIAQINSFFSFHQHKTINLSHDGTECGLCATQRFQVAI